MPDIEKYILAEKDYMTGMTYKDIAEKYGTTLNTVKSWKVRYKWSRDKKGVHTHDNKVCTQNLEKKVKIVADEVEEVMNNSNLTDKQQLFCLYYIRCFNATKAYQKAYACSYENAMVEGCKLLRNPKVKKQISQLKINKLNRELLNEIDIFQKYIDIAFADITDFVIFNNEKIEFTDDQGNQRTATISHVNVKNDSEVDGTLINEVSKGKDGIKIKLADRMRALQWLADHMDLATEEQKLRLDKLQADVDKTTGNKNGEELSKLDRILAELKTQADNGGDKQ